MNLETAVRPPKTQKVRKAQKSISSSQAPAWEFSAGSSSFSSREAGTRIWWAATKRSLHLLFALLPITAFGGEPELQALLERIRQSGSAEFHYEETRTLELASSPWQGQGNMLSGADGSLIKLQLQPARVIMAIANERMYYWDPEQQQRHTAPLGQSGQASELITVFIAILQGHADELKPSYDFVPEQHGKRWTLRLTPKPGLSTEDAATVEISGDEDERKQQVLIRQPDGESTEYRMVKTAEGPQLDNAIQRLLLEAIGD